MLLAFANVDSCFSIETLPVAARSTATSVSADRPTT